MASGRAAPSPIDVFIVDADPAQRRAIASAIADRALGRFAAKACNSAGEALSAAREGSILIADLETLGGMSGLAEMSRAPMPLIATSARGSLNTAVAAVRAGAVDFLAKPVGANQLIERLEAAVSGWRKPEPSPGPGAAPSPRSTRPASTTPPGGFIGQSPAMQTVYEQIRRMGPSSAPIFITGQSGAGKELCAEAVHAESGRTGALVAINCSAIPRDLMESEIFGHVRGAFTGAVDNRPGAAELADDGTLFLDEIGEMDLGLQAKLLRFLQCGTVRRVGGSEETTVDVRIVCATNRDPMAEVAAGRFRADLFYRLHVLPIHLPALAERRDDIMGLARAFLARFAAEENRSFHGFDDAAVDLLVAAPWPGNVRQLQNVLRRIVVLYDGELVSSAMLPPGLLATVPGAQKPVATDVRPFWMAERDIIEAAIDAFAGNIGRAAAALEISPSTIYRKRETWAHHRLS